MKFTVLNAFVIASFLAVSSAYHARVRLEDTGNNIQSGRGWLYSNGVKGLLARCVSGDDRLCSCALLDASQIVEAINDIATGARAVCSNNAKYAPSDNACRLDVQWDNNLNSYSCVTQPSDKDPGVKFDTVGPTYPCADQRCQAFTCLGEGVVKECCAAIDAGTQEDFFDNHISAPDSGKIDIWFPPDYDRSHTDNQNIATWCRDTDQISHVFGSRKIYNYCEAYTVADSENYLSQVTRK